MWEVGVLVGLYCYDQEVIWEIVVVEVVYGFDVVLLVFGQVYVVVFVDFKVYVLGVVGVDFEIVGIDQVVEFVDFIFGDDGIFCDVFDVLFFGVDQMNVFLIECVQIFVVKVWLFVECFVLGFECFCGCFVLDDFVDVCVDFFYFVVVGLFDDFECFFY